MVLKANAIKINPGDNVATALENLTQEAYLKIDAGLVRIALLQEIALGHKFALVDLGKDVQVIKYGEPIGITTTLIKKGEHVHIHNVRSLRGSTEGGTK